MSARQKTRERHRGPIACGKLFAQGNWVNIIAKDLGISEARVEAKLMERLRQLENQVRRMGGRP